MMNLLATTGGALLLVIIGVEVYMTILHSRGRSGIISESINRTVWRVARSVAFRASRRRRHYLLSLVGPLLLPLLIVVSMTLHVIGFALIYLPRMPAEFSVEREAVSSAWIEAFYFSGTTLTTVGYGDISPRSFSMRLVALSEAASGLILITLAVTYLITVYGALERKRAVALSFYHRADEGADAAAYIAHHFVEDRFYGLDATLRAATRDLQNLLEAHEEHPVIHYFHPSEVHKGMPRVLFLTLETCVVIKACLNPDAYPTMTRHPEVDALNSNTRHVLKTLLTSLEPRWSATHGNNIEHIEPPAEELRRWRGRWQQTMARLQEAGISVRVDERASWTDYRTRRLEWEAPLNRFATHLGYDWNEVTGDREEVSRSEGLKV